MPLRGEGPERDHFTEESPATITVIRQDPLAKIGGAQSSSSMTDILIDTTERGILALPPELLAMIVSLLREAYCCEVWLRDAVSLSVTCRKLRDAVLAYHGAPEEGGMLVICAAMRRLKQPFHHAAVVGREVELIEEVRGGACEWPYCQSGPLWKTVRTTHFQQVTDIYRDPEDHETYLMMICRSCYDYLGAIRRQHNHEDEEGYVLGRSGKASKIRYAIADREF